RTEDRAFFLYGFAKSERENIDDDELQTLRDIAAEFLANDDTALDEAVSIGKLQEIENGEDA
ncbi:type II toxin-antitoxin system RelE/ParE family toxin, partial [Pseudomonas aeruginosa]